MANNIEGGRKKKGGDRILSEEAAHSNPACRLHAELCVLRIYLQDSFPPPPLTVRGFNIRSSQGDSTLPGIYPQADGKRVLTIPRPCLCSTLCIRTNKMPDQQIRHFQSRTEDPGSKRCILSEIESEHQAGNSSVGILCEVIEILSLKCDIEPVEVEPEAQNSGGLDAAVEVADTEE